MSKTPPKFPFRLFRWYCDPDIVDDIEGDLLERYEHHYQYRQGASWLLLRDVLLLFRPGIIGSGRRHQKAGLWSFFGFFLKVGWRNTKQANSFSMYNIIGLSLALASTFLIHQYVAQEYQTDSFFSNKERLYRAVRTSNSAEASYRTPLLSAPFRDWLINSLRVEEDDLVRILQEDELVTYDHHSFFESQFFYVDPSFFQLLDYPFLYGDASVLQLPNTVVISHEMAMKYFGKINPIGEILEIDNKGLLKVAGVLAPLPHQSHLDLQFVAPITAMGYTSRVLNEKDAHSFSYYLFSEASPRTLSLPYLQGNQTISWQPMQNVYFEEGLEMDVAKHGNESLIESLILIAVVILLMAGANFLNLALCDFLKKIRTLGVRKAIGSNTRLEVLKQLVETYLSIGIAILIAFVVGFILAETMLKPYIHSLSLDFTFWLLIPVVALVLALPYSLYSFMIISGTSAAQAMARKVSNIRIKALQQGVLSFQFVVVMVLMVMSLLISRQFVFMQERELGLNPEQIFYFNSNNKHSFRNATTILERVKALPGVIGVAMSTGALPHSNAETSSININGIAYEKRLTTVYCSANFPSLMELRLIEGRMFNLSLQSNTNRTAVLNETAAKQLGWPSQNLIGSTMKMLDLPGEEEAEPWKVIGIVNDFHSESLQKTIAPMIMLRSNQEESFVVKMSAASAMQVVDHIAKIWETYVPKYPFTYHFLDEQFGHMHDEATQQRKILYVFLGLAMAIAMFGTLGVSTYLMQVKRKEIALRSVLGAPLPDLGILLFSGYMKTLLISMLISLPLSIYFSKMWLNEFSYRIDFTPGLFVGSVGAIALLVFGVLAIQMRKALTLNPVNELSDE
ncbi:MAG: ABC transporter permease [Cytophagales bacterium]|nr:ABC transporter permease [Cytophagales bacterium]